MIRQLPARRVMQWGVVIVAALLAVVVSAGRTGASTDWPARAPRGGVSRASSRGTDCLSSTVAAREDPETTLLGHVPDPDDQISAVALRGGRPSPVIVPALRRPLAADDGGADLGPPLLASFVVVRSLTPAAGRAPPSV